MRDPRFTKLAKVLVNYSLEIKKNQLVLINADYIAEPLIKEIYLEVLKAGAHPQTRINIPDLLEIFYKNAADYQLSYLSPIRKYEIEKIDAYIGLWGDSNTKALSNVNPETQAKARKAMRPIIDLMNKRELKGELKWVGTCFPTLAYAQDAEMSQEEFEDFVFGACKLNFSDPAKEWKKLSNFQNKIINFLKDKKEIHLKGEETDLTLKVTGRKWINCDGHLNFPDGEVFTSPLEDSVEGKIKFSFPACAGGREVEEVRLEFKKGKVIKASAKKNEEFLNKMLEMDQGAKYVGEFAIGTNYDIKKFTKNILFDEKIGGTAHLALGFSIPQSGGKNKSVLHWDMICDLRKFGEIYADNKMFFKNGKILI
ncbi:MAG: aminopeptidase [Armatimonadetes bacterium]|nr:aminopeptidase [Armatimonadota bacterium]